MMQEWFAQAKLGIFIHYGIYAVDGVAESWSFYHDRISYNDYMKQLDGFTARHFDAEYWAGLIEKSGAKYAVLTAKHHDGVAMYDTQYSNLSVVKKSPSQRDIVKEFNAAIQKRGIRTGIYFSLIDWSHPDYASVFYDNKEPEDMSGVNRYSNPAGGKQDPQKWNRFMDFNRSQLRELLTRYGQVDLLWFDGDWERSDAQWQLPEFKEYLMSFNQNLIVNSRLGSYGDYNTPEQGIPLTRPEGSWEFCTTMNTSWGYVPTDNHYKTPQQVIRMFCDCLSMGGNMLLDIGPREDGTIDLRQEQIMLEIGRWIGDNKEAVYQTSEGIGPMYYSEGSVVSPDRKNLYLFLHQNPKGHICVKGLRSKIERITVLHTGEALTHVVHGGVPWVNIPGTTWICVDGIQPHTYTTIIKIALAEELSLYSGNGVVVTDQ